MLTLTTWMSLESLSNNFLKKVAAKEMFTINVSEILLLKPRSLLLPILRTTGNERVKFSIKHKKLSKLLEKWLFYNLIRF